MIQTADAFVKIDHSRTFVYLNFIYGYTEALLDELHFRYLVQDQDRLMVFKLFLETKVQQTKNISYFILSLFTLTVRTSDYNQRDEA